MARFEDQQLPPRRTNARKTPAHLHSLPNSMPPSKAGKVLWAWPEIVAALDAGWKLKEIWKTALQDGIEMTYKEFTVYVSRIRRKKKHSPPAERERHASSDQISDEPVAAFDPADPFQNLREQREKKRSGGFEFDPFSDNKSLID